MRRTPSHLRMDALTAMPQVLLREEEQGDDIDDDLYGVDGGREEKQSNIRL